MTAMMTSQKKSPQCWLLHNLRLTKAITNPLQAASFKATPLKEMKTRKKSMPCFPFSKTIRNRRTMEQQDKRRRYPEGREFHYDFCFAAEVRHSPILTESY